MRNQTSGIISFSVCACSQENWNLCSFKEKLHSPFSGENLFQCGRDGLWHTQGPGEIIGSATVSVQIAAVTWTESVSWQHPSSQELLQGRSEQQEDSTSRNSQL